MDLITAFLAAATFVSVYFWLRRADPRLPPSPMRPLPLVGHLLHMAADPRPQFKEWRDRCGDIYSLYLGGTLMVVLNGYDLIKEALVKKAAVFSDRPPYYLNEVVGMKNKGIMLSSGDNWKEQRSVGLSILRDFGMGKNLLAEKIQEEVGYYVKYLVSLEGKPTDIRSLTNISTSNIICSILVGHRFEYDDQNFKNMMDNLCSIALEQQNVSLINFFSWLKYIPGDLFKVKKLVCAMETVLDNLMKHIEENRQCLDDSSDPSNLITAYVSERNTKIQAGVPTFLDDRNLLKSMFDLFIAGTETTSTTIYWCVLYMIHNPEVQEKVYEEIQENVEMGRTPTIQDKTQLTYLNAVIAETQRLVSVVPLAITHMCSEEVTIRGYTLPKGTYVAPNLDSVLHDTTTWGSDAMLFRPERFIDDNGKLNIPDEHIPFGIGRRVCLAEAMAKMELFLFLSSMFQKFRFLPPNPGSIPPLTYDYGIVVVPKLYEVRLIERT